MIASSEAVVSPFAYTGFARRSRKHCRMTDTDSTDDLRSRIRELQIEHRDLDAVIARLSQDAVQDQLQLQRLKKRKLQLKDHIATLERQLTPDIPA